MTKEILEKATDVEDKLSRIRHRVIEIQKSPETASLIFGEARVIISDLPCFGKVMKLVENDLVAIAMDLESEFEKL